MSGIIKDLGITPEEARVGDSMIVLLTWHVGADGLPPGARTAVECPGYLGASRPQFLYQEQHAFVTLNISEPDLPWRGWTSRIDGSNPVRTRAEYDALAVTPYRGNRVIQLIWPEGAPAETRITVQLGAPGGGFSPGYVVGCVAPWPGFQHFWHVDVYESEDATERLERATVGQRVHAQGPAIAQVIRHASGRTHLLPQDIFRNPSPVPVGAVAKADEGAFRQTDCGSYVAESASVEVHAAGPAPVTRCAEMADAHAGYHIYWGDLHTHSALSCDVKTAGGDVRPADMLRFGRHGACLDFMALADHHFQIERDRDRAMSRSEWRETLEAVADADEPGAFVAIAGYEHRCRRGDTVVLFGNPPDYDTVSDPSRAPIEALWRTARDEDTITMPHFHNPGHLADGEWLAPNDIALEPVMEVFSCHGRFDVPPYPGMPMAPPIIKLLRDDRTARWMLRHGMRYGVMCSSDGHKGRPGTNGVVAVFAKELTRDAVFDALRNRRCYGTTNARIRLLFTLNDALMGSEHAGIDRGAFRLQVNGTRALRHVDVIRNGAPHRRFTPDGPDFETAWEETFDGPAHYRVTVCQADQEMAFSSPIWIDT